MRVFILVATCFIAISSARPLQAQDEPDFCHDLDCPRYTVVSKTDVYEVREYEASRWAGATIKGDDWYKATNEGFELLFKYIQGANANNTDIPMAAPVATKIVPGQGNEYTFTVLFFTPFKFTKYTPQPTNPSLAIVDLPPITAYVKSFGGFERDSQLVDELAELKRALDKDKASYVKDYYFTAGYDPPYRFLGRHNEVWYIKSS